MNSRSVSAIKSGAMTLWAIALLAGGAMLSLRPETGLWFLGQAVLVVFFNLAFCLMHEFGHQSYFKSRRLNNFLGTIMGIFCFIPFTCWQRIHYLHHKWTGWRDRDPTTRVTVQPVAPVMEKIMNFSWRFWLPVFSIGYRTNTYWNVKLLRSELSEEQVRDCRIAMWAQGLAYAGLFVWMGPGLMFSLFGLAFFVSLSLMDPILLSQHSHIEMPLGKEQLSHLRPMTTAQQVPYTRSIIFPNWVSLLFFSGFDRHEEHHRSPTAPGYELSFRPVRYERSYPAWKWILAAKKVPAAELIFSTEAKTDYKI